MDEAAAGSPGGVLVVDDDPAITSTLLLFLKEAIPGLRVHAAASGQEGLDVLRREPIDLIVSDYRMPDMTGVQFLAEARRVAPLAQRAMFTAFADEKVATEAFEQGGIEHFFTKPLEPEALAGAVKALLKESLAARGDLP